MAQKLQHPDLTPAQFEFELRDHRKIAYNEYVRFHEECKKRKIAFEQAQAKRGFLSRRWHAIVQIWHDHLDNKHEEKLLREAGSYRPIS